jgi:hypothetical protein
VRKSASFGEQPRKPKRFLRILLVWAIWGMLLAAAGEIMARTFLTSPSRQLPDRMLGYINAPHSELFTTSEGFQRLKLNELGLNDERLLPRASDVRPLRVLFVGDSITFAAQVPRDANFTTRLERRLPQIDAVNAGRDALGPHQWPGLIARLRPAVQPDLVVVMVSEGDAIDLFNAHAAIERGAGGEPKRVVFSLNDKDAIQEKLGPLLRHSALATAVGRRAGVAWQAIRNGDSWLGWVLRGGKKPAAPAVESSALNERVLPQLTEIMTMVKRQGPVMFVAVPTFDFAKPDLGLGGGGAFRLYAQAAQAAGAPYRSLVEPMRTIYERDRRPFNGFANSKIGTGHMNAYGHSVVAGLLAQIISAPTGSRSDGVVPSPSRHAPRVGGDRVGS